MHSQRNLQPLFFGLIGAVASVAAAQAGPPSNVVLWSGNGQVVQQFFLTTVPLAIRVTDAAGTPVGGVPLTWAITQGASFGSLNQPSRQTSSDGLATTMFLGSALQPGTSFGTATVTATTTIGSVNFFVTLVSSGLQVELKAPTQDNLNITGSAGATLPGAVSVAVSPTGGFSQGQGIPNVGVRIVNGDTGNTAAPPAACNAPAGTVLTDAKGIATCDLILGSTPGIYTVTALAGEAQKTRTFTITITPGQSCTFTLSPPSQSPAFSAAAGTGTVNVSAQSGCSWTATTNSSFITINSGASGSGNGVVNYSVAANTGPSRSGTISIAGQTFTVNQSGTGGPGPLTITTGSSLPGAIVNSGYSTALSASGGQPPYSWQVTSASLPPGLSLGSSTGAIAGTPSAAGTFSFTITLKDSLGSVQSQSFSIAVVGAGSGGITITNTGFPSGSLGVPYQQALTFASAPCGSPFSPPPAFTLASGALPPGLSVQSTGGGYSITGTPTAQGTFSFTLNVSNSCGQTGSAPFSIVINGAGTTTLSANPPGLTFSFGQNGPAPQAQQLSITSTGGSVAFTAGAATTSGGNWLSVSPSSPSTPATLTVGVLNLESLAAGSYQGSITITGPDNNTLAIPVTLAVLAGEALSVTPVSLTFNLPANTSSQQVVAVQSSGAPLQVNTAVQSVSGGDWIGIQPGPVTTPASVTVTANTAGLSPGKYLANITLSPTGTATPVQVQVVLNVLKSTLTVDTPSIMFSYQAGASSFPSQTINLLSSGAPIPVTVSATTATGGNWLSAALSGGEATAATVSVDPSNLAPGTYNGAVTITPQDLTIAGVTIPVTLTVVPGPGPVVNGVINAASGTPGQVSPGEFISIFGSAMAQGEPSQLTLTSSNLVATSLGGTRVLFDGLPAPLIYVSATQINAVVPYEVYGRVSTQLQIEYNGVRSIPVSLGVAASAPGIFLAAPPNPTAQAAALNQDGSVNSATNGAVAGSVISLFATGEGQTDPAGVTGSITGATLPIPLLPATVRIGGLPADVIYAGSAPSLVAGVLQVNVRLPAGLPAGVPVPVILTVGDVTSNHASIVIVP